MQISFVIAALTAVASAADPSFNDASYIGKSAAQKIAQIWSSGVVSTSPQGWYNAIEMAGLLTESMSPTMQQVGDQMPKGSLYGTRSKYIHTEGTIATVKLTNSGSHPFTGVFKGGDHGVVRLSFAAKPDPKVLNTTPGMGLKFLRDGIDSVNLVAMYSVDGQDSWNFFKNDFSNHIPAFQSKSLAPVAAKFSTATPWIQTVGLSNWAQWDQSGKAVASPVFPFSLRFHPTGQIEFSDSYDGTYFLDHLSSIPSGSTLYQVYGLDAPKELGGKEYHIGDLITTSIMTKSTWGDDHLFFRHQDMAEDLKIHPEWTAHTPKYGNGVEETLGALSLAATSVAHKVKSACPFAHLFQ